MLPAAETPVEVGAVKYQHDEDPATIQLFICRPAQCPPGGDWACCDPAHHSNDGGSGRVVRDV